MNEGAGGSRIIFLMKLNYFGHKWHLTFLYIFGIAGITGWFLLAIRMNCSNNAPCPTEGKWDLVAEYKEKIKQSEDQILALKIQLDKITEFRNRRILLENSNTIFIVTPTYTRPEQKAELTRLSQTLLHISNFHWIVVEDSSGKTPLVSNFLKECGLNYTHLDIKTPEDYKLKSTDPNWLKPRGVLQRNLALKWLRENIDINTQKGVLYFADDDNTYSLKIFQEMRDTKVVSVWPVGLVGGLRYEKPLIQKGKVVQWFTYWKPTRPFAMDMAGFAINLKRIFQYMDAKFDYKVPRGYQESALLQGLRVNMSDLEPKADFCTKILVWHTRTEKTKLKNEERMKKRFGHGSNPNIEL